MHAQTLFAASLQTLITRRTHPFCDNETRLGLAKP